MSLRGDGCDLDEVDLGGRRARVALALLVHRAGRAVTHEALVGALWGDVDRPSAEASLREVLSRLRTALAGTALADQVASGRGWYRLDLPDGVEVDLSAADRDLEAATRACAAGDATGALALVRAALATTTAPFLPGETSEWAVGVRSELEASTARALETAVEASAAAGRTSEAVGWAEQLVARLPLRERSHLALMRARHADGDRAEALRVYDRCRRMLAEELGVEPGPELRALHLALLADDAAPGDEDGPPPVPGLPVSVPQDLPFVDSAGRLRRLAAHLDAAAGSGGRLVLLTGVAGSGRTRLCAELARRLPPGALRYGRQDRDGAPRQALDEALRASAPSGGTGAVPTEQDCLDALVGLAGAGPAVVVLDDLQWADAWSWHVVRRAVRRLPALPGLLLVLSLRGPDRRARCELGPLYRDVPVHELGLGRLAAPDLAVLVDRRWPQAPAEARERAVSVLSARTAGLPFLVGLLLDEVDGLGLGLDPTALAECVPPGVAAAVQERLSDLHPGTRAVAQRAALGPALVDPGVLAERCGLALEPVEEHLDELVEQGVLVHLGAGGGHCFAEPLLRDAVARSAPASWLRAPSLTNVSLLPAQPLPNSRPAAAP